MSKIVIKINPTDANKRKMIPNWVSDETMTDEQRRVAAKAVYIVGPYSVGFDKAFMPYFNGVYREHNRNLVNSLRMNNLGAGPLFAMFHDGFWMTEEELKMYCMSDAYSCLMNEVSNGAVILEKDDGTQVSLKDIMGYVGDTAGSNPTTSGSSKNYVDVSERSSVIVLNRTQYNVYTVEAGVEELTFKAEDETSVYTFELDLRDNPSPTIKFTDSEGNLLMYDQVAPEWESYIYQVSICGNRVAVAKLVEA